MKCGTALSLLPEASNSFKFSNLTEGPILVRLFLDRLSFSRFFSWLKRLISGKLLILLLDRLRVLMFVQFSSNYYGICCILLFLKLTVSSLFPAYSKILLAPTLEIFDSLQLIAWICLRPSMANFSLN